MFKFKPTHDENGRKDTWVGMLLTVLALRHARISREASEVGHGGFEDIGRQVRGKRASLLYALVPEGGGIDSAVVGVYGSGKTEPEVPHATRRQSISQGTEDTAGETHGGCAYGIPRNPSAEPCTLPSTVA